MVIHLCKDLMLGGKVSSWANANHVAYRRVPSVQKLQEALLESGIEKVLVDIQIRDLDLPQLIADIRDYDRELPIIGYAQHVLVDLISAAESAGFDQVMTRGQFDRQFPHVIGAN